MTSKFIPPDPRQTTQRPQLPDLSLATDIVCEQCDNMTFEEVLLMKKVSALVSPNGKEGIIPIPTFACVACGHVNQMFRPNTKPVEQQEAQPERPTLSLEK